MTKKMYSIPVQWEMEGLMEIEADSFAEALCMLYQEQSFPKDQYYVDNTFEAQEWYVKQQHEAEREGAE